MQQTPFIAVAIDGEGIGVSKATTIFAGPAETDLTWVIAFPFVEAAGGEVEDDVDDGVFAGFFAPEAGAVDVVAGFAAHDNEVRVKVVIRVDIDGGR